MLTTLAVENYRSLRNLVVPLGRLNVIKGVNGSGKSNLYKSLRLLADVGVLAAEMIGASTKPALNSRIFREHRS